MSKLLSTWTSYCVWYDEEIEIILEFETYDRYGSNYVWTREMAQDLAAYIAAEIDRNIIQNLLNNE